MDSSRPNPQQRLSRKALLISSAESPVRMVSDDFIRGAPVSAAILMSSLSVAPFPAYRTLVLSLENRPATPITPGGSPCARWHRQRPQSQTQTRPLEPGAVRTCRTRWQRRAPWQTTPYSPGIDLRHCPRRELAEDCWPLWMSFPRPPERHAVRRDSEQTDEVRRWDFQKA